MNQKVERFIKFSHAHDALEIRFLLLLMGIVSVGLIALEDSFAFGPVIRFHGYDETQILDLEGNQIDSIHAGQQVIISAPSFTSQPPRSFDSPSGCAETTVKGNEVFCVGYLPSHKLVEGDKLVDADNSRFFRQVTALTQVTDSNGVTVSLSWITGVLGPDSILKPQVSWIPEKPGTYDIVTFFWVSVDNPTALAPPSATDVVVV